MSLPYRLQENANADEKMDQMMLHSWLGIWWQTKLQINWKNIYVHVNDIDGKIEAERESESARACVCSDQFTARTFIKSEASFK